MPARLDLVAARFRVCEKLVTGERVIVTINRAMIRCTLILLSIACLWLTQTILVLPVRQAHPERRKFRVQPWLPLPKQQAKACTLNYARATLDTRFAFLAGDAVRMTRHPGGQVASMAEKRRLLIKKLGRVEYGAALLRQKETELAVKEGRQADTLLLLEHPHTLTVGRRGDSTGILLSPESLAARGVTVFETNRGGRVTYHGLGQIVGYPIVNLSPDREDVHAYVRDLEQVLIRALADFEIQAFRIEGLTGVHTSRGKVAAIGVHIARLGNDARLRAKCEHRSKLL